MGRIEKGVTPQELVAFGIGLAVTVGSALLTSLVNPIAFPLNVLVSFGLGGTALYGARKLLDPRTLSEVEEQRTNAEFRSMLDEIAGIAERTTEASRNPHIDVVPSRRLGTIARMMHMILERHRERKRDFAGVSATLLVLQKVDGILGHYLRVRGGAVFMDASRSRQVVSEVEDHVMPMVERALENLGKRLDHGETISTDISQETLESMLRSLDLIETLQDQPESGRPEKEAPDDT